MWLAVAGITLLAAIGFGVLALAVQSERAKKAPLIAGLSLGVCPIARPLSRPFDEQMVSSTVDVFAM